MPRRTEPPPLAVLRELLDHAGDGLVALDGDGKVVEANAAAAAQLGRPRDFMIGKPFTVFVAPADRSDFRTAVRTAYGDGLDLEIRSEDGQHMPLTLRTIVADGQRFLTMTLHEDRAQRPQPPPAPPAFDLASFLLRLPQAVISFDRSGRVVLANHPARRLLAPDRIRVGAELPDTGHTAGIRELVERLAVLRAPLPPRTIALRDGRILRASGTPAHDGAPAILQLEDMTREWQDDHRNREFVRDAAHQLRTPLAAISSAVDVLDAGAKDNPETLERFLVHIRTHADRLTRLTRGLLVLARIEDGEPPRLDFVELQPLLRELAATTERPVIVRCPDSLAALADTDLLHEALAALLDNAVRHGQEGEIFLSAREVAGDVSISVADTGPGILPEHRARVLEPFYRIGAGGEGFGLGLAIVSRAVRAMGGELQVDSSQGAGARFVILLRAATVVR